MTTILRNQKGIAIGVVLTAIVILTTIIANFSIETNINKFKAYNIEDKAKAKLTAESGLQFAMARLRLYKEAYNFLQENKSAQDLVKQEMLNILWNFPFVYPIPISNSLTKIQKDSIGKFQNESFLEGSLNLSISNLSNKINLNLIRVSLFTKEELTPTEEEDLKDYDAEAQLFTVINNFLVKKNEEDDTFFREYGNIEADDLVNDLKYYISDPDTLESTSAQRRFDEISLEPKLAPIQSFTELYHLPSWKDEMVDLVKNEFTVHGAIMIDLNKITDTLLKLLFPGMTDDEVSEFFKYKNDPDNPQFFNSLDDLKNYIVNIANITTESEFTERFEKFKKKGLQFGPTPTLFKIISTAKQGRSSYTLTATVVIPAEPKPLPPPVTNKPEDEVEPIDDSKKSKEPPEDSNEDESSAEDKEDKKTLLLEPRIVEINIS